MPIQTMTPSPQQVVQLRNMFVEKYTSSPPAVDFHPADVNRIRNDDLWCIRFLEMYDLDLNVSFEKMWSTCIWRQKFGANDLNETNVRMDYLTDGVIFPHNKDVDGKPLLIFKTKKHVKGSKDMNDVMKVLVYWVERIHRETHLEKITIFFDMDGTGLSGMDLEFVKMIIETFKMYYPNALNYILVFEMAWVLFAAFQIVKGLLPEKAVDILRIITMKNISTYIDKDNCLASWGGTDGYEFSFVPEVRYVAKVQEDSTNTLQDKKVHFANSIPTRVPEEQSQQMHDIPEDSTRKMDSESSNQYIATRYSQNRYEMLYVSPENYLKFARGDTKDTTVELTCRGPGSVTYKIQTTSPEKFRVRPRCGILKPGESLSVSILLKPEHTLSDKGKDKFLIMSLPSEDIKANQVADFWKKHGQSEDIEQHRLCCAYEDTITATGQMVGNDISASSGDDKNAKYVPSETKKLEKQLRYTQILQIVTLVFLLILAAAVIYLLKLQLCGDEGCMVKDPSADSVDFATCAKGKADL